MLPRLLKGIHWPLVSTALLLTAAGILAIYSASFRAGADFWLRQLTWAAFGLLAFFAALWLGYRPFLNLSYLLYGAALFLLGFVLMFGESRSGASRWIALGPFALQPSELCKAAAILALANFLAERSSFAKQKTSLFIASVLAAAPAVLILKQPDLGSALVFVPILIGILFLWGVRLRYLTSLALAALAAAPFLWHSLKPYQQKRLMVFLNPSVDPIGASYTAIQSRIAVGSGGLFGKGWLQGTQTQLDFVPEHHTDFIFSVIGEEFGFLGSLAILVLFALLIGYAFQIIQSTTDLRARLVAGGIVCALFFQCFVNIGMTIGLAPITGVTLPFVSYGGSSLIASFFAVGLLASIYRERSIF